MAGWWDAIPAVAGMVGSAVGHAQAQPARDRALGLAEDSYKRALELLSSGQLEYTPELAQAVQQGPSAFQNVSPDELSMMAQKDALNKLSQASEEGYGAVDKAAINRAMTEANNNEQAQRQAAMRGLQPGSGASVAAKMMAQQGSANRANQQALDVAAASRKQALSALAGYGNLASNIREQSFNEGAQKAQAMDAISRFNAANSQQVGLANQAAANRAKEAKTGNRLGALGLASGAANAYGQGLYGAADRDEKFAAGMTQATGNSLYQLAKDDEKK